MLDSIFSPLLNLQPFWIIIIMSFFISIFMTIIYKLMTDQELMKSLKKEMKELQKEMREFREHPDKVMAAQKKVMEKNMKYMMHSLKPTLITFIPIILVLGWFNSHMIYQAITPGSEFSTTLEFEQGTMGNVTIILPEGFSMAASDASVKTISDDKVKFNIRAGDLGDYTIDYKIDGKTFTKDVIVSYKQQYSDPVMKLDDGYLEKITIQQDKLIVLNLFGWKLGWLGSYIIFSILFSLVVRKLLRVH